MLEFFNHENFTLIENIFSFNIINFSDITSVIMSKNLLIDVVIFKFITHNKNYYLFINKFAVC
ncbi:hypothetical protein A6S26_11625 [Nostoc sp. ATCC 43529]|nr:hypothetical protein A6S26_11625 [Nostoc sp. ATCC 43529]